MSDQLPEFEKDLLQGIKLTGFEDPQVRRVLEAAHIMQRSGLSSYKSLLPLLLSLNGRPYTLDRLDGKDTKYSPGFAPFETFYRTRVPRQTLFITGRQVAKTSNLTARGIIHAASVPFFTTLYITPLFEMVRRLSQNYMGPFIENSPIKSLLTGTSSNGSVLQRNFVNGSKMIFSFAYLNADRTRGISANRLVVDELQNLAMEHMAILRETMSASPYGEIIELAGTPMSMENTIQGVQNYSSQAEWCIKCHHCGYWNIPALAYDLDKMIGPLRENICYERPGTVCAKCCKPVLPHLGRWVHAHPKLRWDFASYHIPQIIMPMHYANREKWAQLLGKRDGAGNTPLNVFYNEVCGESYDMGSRIITLTELRRACILPWPRDLTPALQGHNSSDYIARVLACDWGGGGIEGMSYTVYAVMGMRADGKIDVIFAYRSLRPHDHEHEARLAIGLASKFKCHAICHDYTGAGSLRETFIIQAKYPYERVIPVAYVRVGASARIMQFKPGTKGSPRSHYIVDKTRSLMLTCNQIKSQWIRFFKYDKISKEDDGVICDFLALVDEKTERKNASDIFTIIRDPTMRDDFAQAVNIGACTLWNMTDKWPDISLVAGLKVSAETLAAIHPQNKDVMRDLL